MQFFTTISMTIMALATTASAGCFTTGIDGDRAFANAVVSSACDYLNGPFNAGQSKFKCFNYANDRYDFTIYNLYTISNFMDHTGCVDFMKREIGCSKGGDRTYPELGWRFVADPNQGSAIC